LKHGAECDLCLSSRALYLSDRHQQPIALSREVFSRAVSWPVVTSNCVP
jgi:hypothetical protein